MKNLEQFNEFGLKEISLKEAQETEGGILIGVAILLFAAGVATGLLII